MVKTPKMIRIDDEDIKDLQKISDELKIPVAALIRAKIKLGIRDVKDGKDGWEPTRFLKS